MASYLFQFVHNDTCVALYKDDEGLYHVVTVRDSRDNDGKRTEFPVGVLFDKSMALHVFNHECQRIQREWELS